MKKAVKKVEEEEEDSGSDLDVDEGYEDSDEDEAAQNDLKRGAVVSKVRPLASAVALAPPMRAMPTATRFRPLTWA